ECGEQGWQPLLALFGRYASDLSRLLFSSVAGARIALVHVTSLRGRAAGCCEGPSSDRMIRLKPRRSLIPSPSPRERIRRQGEQPMLARLFCRSLPGLLVDGQALAEPAWPRGPAPVRIDLSGTYVNTSNNGTCEVYRRGRDYTFVNENGTPARFRFVGPDRLR